MKIQLRLRRVLIWQKMSYSPAPQLFLGNLNKIYLSLWPLDKTWAGHLALLILQKLHPENNYTDWNLIIWYKEDYEWGRWERREERKRRISHRISVTLYLTRCKTLWTSRETELTTIHSDFTSFLQVINLYLKFHKATFTVI